jgi:hypothetical protein
MVLFTFMLMYIHPCNFKLSACFRVTSTKCHINTVVFPDDGHSHLQHVEKRNKLTKKDCAPIWFYLQECANRHPSFWGEVKAAFSCLCFNCNAEYDMYSRLIFVLVIMLTMM